MNWNTMEYHNDHFEIQDDEHDTIDITTDELNRYFSFNYVETVMDQQYYVEQEERLDEMMEVDPPNEQSVTAQVMENEEEVVEEVLSQKLSQLSTEIRSQGEEEEDDADDFIMTNKKRQFSSTSPSSSDAMPKKFKSTASNEDDTNDAQNSYNSDLEKELNKIPYNLFKTNQMFIDLTRQVRNQSASSITSDHIQHLALVLYRLAVIHAHKLVTMTCFKSGTGTLRAHDPDLQHIIRYVWPKEVKAVLVEKVKRYRRQQQQPENTIIAMSVETEQNACEEVVYDRLEHLNHKTEQYQQELNEVKAHLVGLTSKMEAMIEKYVDVMVIRPLTLKCNLKIALLKYDYDAEMIERRFSHETPNEYQTTVAQRLYKARDEFEKAKRQLIELKQRLIYNKPFTYISSQQMATDQDKGKSQAYTRNKQTQLKRQQQFDTMAIQIFKLERQYYQAQKSFNDELSTMWQNHRSLVEDKVMTMTLINLIEQRLTNMTDRWRERFVFRLNYFIINSYADWDTMEENNTTKSTEHKDVWLTNIGFEPCLFIDTMKQQHLFNDQQLKLLNRGPTYVAPYQIHTTSPSSLSMDDILRKQYAPLKRQLAGLFTKYKIDVILQFAIQSEVYERFKQHFSMPLSARRQKRAIYEKQIIDSIRDTIKKHNLILRRTADQMNTFYLGSRSEFDKKTNDYLMNTDDYELFYTSNEEQQTEKCQQDLLYRMKRLTDFINNSLKLLRRRKDIDEELFQRLVTDLDQVQLSYLYFLPDISKMDNDIKLVPMFTISTSHMTYKISQYLDQLLRPFAQEFMQSGSFTQTSMKPGIFADEIHFIQQFNTYVGDTTWSKQVPLTPTTLFCTMKVLNYSTLDIQTNMIDIICNFIQQQLASNRLGNIQISIIKNLLQLCLIHNVFAYQNKLYKFKKGGPKTLPLTDTLANIYLFVWQRKLYREMEEKYQEEFFGRYKDQLFFTWHRSKEDFEMFIRQTKQTYPDVHLQALSAPSINYLNAYLANQNGQLYSRIYHHPNMQLYTLPYVTGHAKVKYSNWIRSALLHAVCYCTLVEDFNQERICIELTCLANGYSYCFVESRVGHFYDYFRMESLRYDMNQSTYDTWRQKWLDYVDMQRLLVHQLQDYQPPRTYLFRFHYLYEYGSRCDFNKEFHQLYLKHFHQYQMLRKEKTLMTIYTKHIYSLNTLLTQQK